MRWWSHLLFFMNIMISMLLLLLVLFLLIDSDIDLFVYNFNFTLLICSIISMMYTFIYVLLYYFLKISRRKIVKTSIISGLLSGMIIYIFLLPISLISAGIKEYSLMNIFRDIILYSPLLIIIGIIHGFIVSLIYGRYLKGRQEARSP
jgi:hypothetical protein